MRKIHSIAIGMLALCSFIISASKYSGDEKATKIGETFCKTVNIEKPNPLPQNNEPKKISSNNYNIEDLLGQYSWNFYSYLSNSSGWTTSEMWINEVRNERGERTDSLTIQFSGWSVKAFYDKISKVISIDSNQFITYNAYNDIDVYFYHCRWNEETQRDEYIDSPLEIRIAGGNLVMDENDYIVIGLKEIGYFIYASYNSFEVSGKPSGYSRVGNTQLYSKVFGNIDIYGLFNRTYYKSTYGNGGYKVSVKVNGGNAQQMDCSAQQTIDGINFIASVEQQGEFARISYILTNPNDVDATVSLGTHADVMIGSNDAAPITRRIDTLGQTYGLTMSDGYGAQLCVLFGAGIAGVSAVDDFWFGHYSTNSTPNSMVGNYNPGGNYMVENGHYDSGMGWCWKNRTIPAGSTVTFSYLIGVGDVNLEPNFSFAVTPDDPDGWNDLSLPHRLTINGEYNSPAGVEGRIEYSVEDSEEWIPLTGLLASGSEFENSMTLMFDENRPTHLIRFRTIDNVGNTTMLQPIEYIDVKYIDISGIEDRTYNGQPHIQNVVSEQLEDDQFVTAGYVNNIDAGVASFRIDGVFPYSIGRSINYHFRINPQPLESTINLNNDSYVFNNDYIYPEWSFDNSNYQSLIRERDFNLTYKNNRYPGTGSIEISGINNYTGKISKDFFIDKAPLNAKLYSTTIPESDIVYDGNNHAATFTGEEGVGIPTFKYIERETYQTYDTVSNAGHYDIYLSIADGDYYYGESDIHLGSFSIYNFDGNEWQTLNVLNTQLQQSGFTNSWNVNDGITAVGTFRGLDIKEGHIIGINLSGEGLSGTLPEAIFTLSKLKKLDVSDNDLSGNLPLTLAAMANQSGLTLAAIDTLDMSGNKFNGNLGVLSNCMPSLIYLDASNNKFEDVYPAIPASVKYLNISNQKIDRTIDLNLSNIDIASIITQIPTIILYNTDSHEFMTNFNLLITTENQDSTNEDEDDIWSIQLNVSHNNVIPLMTGNNTYRGKSGDILSVYRTQNGTSDGSTFNVKLNFDQGDANFFNGIDATDLQATILYAFGLYNTLPFNFTAANTYEDDFINVQDVTCTVNIILSQLSEMQAGSPAKVSRMLNSEETEARIILTNGKVILYSDKPIAALTLKASEDFNWLTSDYGLTQTIVGGNMVAYSLSGAEIPAGENVIGEYSGQANISYASLSDSSALPVSVNISSESITNVNELPFEIDGDCEIYDVMGTRHSELVNGLNIIVRDGKSVKYYNTK